MGRGTLTLAGVVLLSALVAPAAQAESWQPPEPAESEMDWIQMNSGEWLAGEIKFLRDLDLDFDSDELDLLNLDWSDVQGLRSSRSLVYRFDDDMGTFTGTAVMRDGTVSIRTAGGVRELPADKLILIVTGGQSEWDYWSGRVSVGTVTRSGNTNQEDLNALLRLRRRTPKSRVMVDYAGNYGRVEEEQTINNHNFTAGVDALITAGFFLNPFTINLFRDPFTNIDLKTTVSAGVGYDILRGGDLEWTVGLSGGYTTTKSVSVVEGEDDRESSGTVIPSTELDWDITPDFEFLLSYNATIGIPEVRNTVHHGAAVFSFDIVNDILELDLSLNWDRVESPRADADGNVPARDDFRTAFGIGLDF